jgi:hypothetical protein
MGGAFCIPACKWARTLPAEGFESPRGPECRSMKSGSFGYRLTERDTTDNCRGFEPVSGRSNATSPQTVNPEPGMNQ